MARPQRAHRGQSLVEYSMILAFVCIGCVAAISYFQRGVADTFEAQQTMLREPTFSAANYIPPPTNTPTPTRTPVVVPTATSAGIGLSTMTPTPPAPDAAATATATTVPVATATPTATATANTATRVTITAQLNNDPASNQMTQYWIQLNNTGTTAIANMSARVYLNLSEIFAAGLSANNVVVDEYWDQCGTAQLSSALTWDAARQLYYIQITWQGQTFNNGDSCQTQFGIRLSGWQNFWNGANDPSRQGLGTTGMTTTTAIPAYRNGTLVYGSEP